MARLNRRRALTLAWALLTGFAFAASVPPWGFWPFAFIGVASLDRLIADRPARSRAKRAFVVTIGWFGPSILWMIDLTPPGYLVALAVFGAMYAGAAALCPPGPWRRLALPAVLVLAEAVRGAFPFGGAPLSTLAMSLAGSPLLPIARVAGPLGLIGIAGVGGVTLSVVLDRRWRPAIAGPIVVLAALGLSAVAPTGHDIAPLEVALVQGGGKQQTRFASERAPEVFQAHLEATNLVRPPVDLVLWPENVVNVAGDFEDYQDGLWLQAVQEAAGSVDAVLVPGIFEDHRDTNTNYSLSVAPDGEILDRYDKEWLVPFGEFVPLRSVVQPLADATGVGDELPQDAQRGSGPATLDSPTGRMGVMISWEVFFAHRARSGVRNGGEILVNPTNGSSYWLTQVQTQQVASSRLRAVETGRWLLQAAPTGFSALIDPDGQVLERSAVSERRVIQGTAWRRSGLTWAVRFGDWPALLASMAALAAAWIGTQRGWGRLVRADLPPSRVEKESTDDAGRSLA